MKMIAESNIVSLKKVDRLKDTIRLIYSENHHQLIKDLRKKDIVELIGIACDFLQQIHVLFRMIGWLGNTNRFKRFLLAEISDSTHNLPPVIKNRDINDLTHYIAEYMCLLLAIKKEFDLVTDLLDDPALVLAVQGLIKEIE